jgi:hypothetical protein
MAKGESPALPTVAISDTRPQELIVIVIIIIRLLS